MTLRLCVFIFSVETLFPHFVIGQNNSKPIIRYGTNFDAAMSSEEPDAKYIGLSLVIGNKTRLGDRDYEQTKEYIVSSLQGLFDSYGYPVIFTLSENSLDDARVALKLYVDGEIVPVQTGKSGFISIQQIKAEHSKIFEVIKHMYEKANPR